MEGKGTGTRDPSRAVVAGPVPCPPDLCLSEQQVQAIGMHVPEWAIQRITVTFVGKAVANQSDRRTLEAWRKCLLVAITETWNNADKRPRQSTEEPEFKTATDILAEEESLWRSGK